MSKARLVIMSVVVEGRTHARDLCLRKPRRLAEELTNSCRFLGVVVVVAAMVVEALLVGSP